MSVNGASPPCAIYSRWFGGWLVRISSERNTLWLQIGSPIPEGKMISIVTPRWCCDQWRRYWGDSPISAELSAGSLAGKTWRVEWE